jgi:hypothetical protein
MGSTGTTMHKICVATDLEPDDVLALAVLHGRKFAIKAVLVGEGDPRAKSHRALEYLSALGVADAVVTAGAPSDKLFPGEAPSAADTAFDAPSAFRYFEGLVDSGIKHVLYLKPPRELLAMWTADQARARTLFQHLHLGLYGSFNLRVLGYVKTAWMTSADECPFASVRLYQNVGGLADDFTGEAIKNLNPGTCPEFFGRAVDGHLKQVMHVWDSDVVKDCVDTCAGLGGIDGPPNGMDDERWRRNRTCYDQVSANFGRQIVAADPVLAAVVWSEALEADATTLSSVDMVFDGSKTYPVPVPSPGSRVKLYHGMRLSAVTDILLQTQWF